MPAIQGVKEFQLLTSVSQCVCVLVLCESIRHGLTCGYLHDNKCESIRVYKWLDMSTHTLQFHIAIGISDDKGARRAVIYSNTHTHTPDRINIECRINQRLIGCVRMVSRSHICGVSRATHTYTHMAYTYWSYQRCRVGIWGDRQNIKTYLIEGNLAFSIDRSAALARTHKKVLYSCCDLSSTVPKDTRTHMPTHAHMDPSRPDRRDLYGAADLRRIDTHVTKDLCKHGNGWDDLVGLI